MKQTKVPTFKLYKHLIYSDKTMQVLQCFFTQEKRFLLETKFIPRLRYLVAK